MQVGGGGKFAERERGASRYLEKKKKKGSTGKKGTVSEEKKVKGKRTP